MDVDTRFKAAIPMGGTGPISRDVPTLVMAGLATPLWKASLFGPSIRPCQMLRWPRSEVLVIWPFPIFATLILGVLVKNVFPRDDINAFFVESLIELGTDGCPQKELVTPPNEDCAADMDLEISKWGFGN